MRRVTNTCSGSKTGASENTEALKTLLVHLREHCVGSERRHLFVIDGAKALRAAINEVFGAHQPVPAVPHP